MQSTSLVKHWKTWVISAPLNWPIHSQTLSHSWQFNNSICFVMSTPPTSFPHSSPHSRLQHIFPVGELLLIFYNSPPPFPFICNREISRWDGLMAVCDSSLCSLQTPGVGKINKHIWQSRRLWRKQNGAVCKRMHPLRKQKLFNDSISGRANGVLILMGVIIDKHFNPTLKQVQDQQWWGLCHTEGAVERD